MQGLRAVLALVLGAAVIQTQVTTLEDRATVIPEMLRDGQTYVSDKVKYFCYKFSEKPGIKHIWSAVKVKINSSGLLQVSHPGEQESIDNDPKTFIDFLLSFYYGIVSSSKAPVSEVFISIECYSSQTCFVVSPVVSDTMYTVTVTRRPFEPKLIFLFMAGIILFLCARTFSRSVLFYYSAGVGLGLMAISVLIVLVSKRLMGVRPFLLLLSGSWSVSLLIIYLGVLNLGQILTKYRHYALGYLCVVGCFSFAICYKHGPLSNEHSINLLTWTLKLMGSVLVYCGVTLSQFAYTVLIALLCINNLHHPAKLVHSVYRKLKGPAKKAANPFLTEDEYREQIDAVTLIALENLRQYCRGQEFPAWETVMRISSPKRLADFILKGQHLTQEEMSRHDELYGLGGSFLEAQLFVTEENSRSGSEIWEDPNEEGESDESQTIDFSSLVIEQVF